MQYLAKLQCHFHGRRIIGEVEAVGGRNAVFFRSASSKRERVGCGLMGSWWDHGRIGRSFKLYFISFFVAERRGCIPFCILLSAHRTGRFMCYDYYQT